MNESHRPQNPLDHTDAIARLKQLLGERCSTSDEERQARAGDASWHSGPPPEMVVFPQSTDEVAEVARICHAAGLTMIPRGTGTAVEGGVVASRGGVCLDLGRMNRIVAIRPRDRDATVEAGVTRKQLNAELTRQETGLFFPVDPGADASLGGMAATSASGSAAVGYGTMRENVLALRAVTADGRILQTGTRARKSSAGYDLTRLLVGSEGTLAIITEVTLRLRRVPAAVVAGTCAFATEEQAVEAVLQVFDAGVEPVRMELLDAVQMAAVNAYSQLGCAEQPTLFFELHGGPASVAEQAAAIERVFGECGGQHIAHASEQAARERLWKARHEAYYASLALRPGGAGYVTDVCVPVSQLAECIRRARVHLRASTVPCPLFGHVGDGNFHVVFVIEPGNREELQQVQAIHAAIVADAIALEGTCSGEHGIGLGKLDALEQQYGETLSAMRDVRRALDPRGLLNPGKVLRMPE